jgi:hypothetical protein
MVASGARQLNIVLYQHSIVQHSHPSRAEYLAIFGKARTVKDDVICLPLSRGP